MGTKYRELVRYAVLAKGTGEVLKIKHMRFGYQPTLDPERFLAVKVGESVEPGMVQNAEGFAWPK